MKAEQKSAGFDQFLFIGIPPFRNKSSKPKVLAVFPSIELPDLSFQTLIDYSLPYGVEPSKLPIYKNIISDMFCFSFLCHDVRFYGATVIINPICGEIPFFASESTKNTLFALTVISRNTQISAHFTFLSHLSMLMASQTKEMIEERFGSSLNTSTKAGIEKLPDSFKDYIITNCIAHNPDILLPKEFSDVIFSYFRHNSDTKLFLSRDFIINPQPKISSEEEKELLVHKQLRALSYNTLFSLLSIDNIVKLFTGFILDRQIVIFGSVLQEVSMCIFALNEMLFGLKYTGTFIPTLPIFDNYIQILNAPTPFLIGAYGTDQLTNIEFDESAIFVNLDAREIEISVELPQYPSQKKVIKKLKRVLNVTAFSKPDPLAFPSFFREKDKQNVNFSSAALEEIMNILKNPMSNVLTDEIFAFFITNLDSNEEKTTEFNKELFISILPEEEKQFFQELFESQTFTYYLHDVLLKYSRERGQRCVVHRKKRTLERKISRKISASFFSLQPTGDHPMIS